MPVNNPALTPKLSSYVESVVRELDQIPAERRRILEQISGFVTHRPTDEEPSKLTFICTHNSRRSHLSQIWAQTAAFFFGISCVETFSGGTERSAFNPRAVAAIQRAGFLVDEVEHGDNPVYEVRYSEDTAPMRCFSKVYDESPNPRNGFAAVMTCSNADEGCPMVLGATARIAILYDDPKASDGSDSEIEVYDERCRQIAREMLYVFRTVAQPETSR